LYNSACYNNNSKPTERRWLEDTLLKIQVIFTHYKLSLDGIIKPVLIQWSIFCSIMLIDNIYL